MDLSAFGGAAAPPPPPQPAPAAPPSHQGGAPRGAAPHRHGPPGRGRARGRHRGRAAHGRRGRGRGDDRYDDYEGEDDRPSYRDRKKGPNTALIVGSIAGVVVAVILLVLFMSKDKPPVVKPKPVVQKPKEPEPPPPPPVEIKRPPPKPKVEKGREDEKRPELREGRLEDVPIPEGKRKYRANQAELKEYDWPDYVTAEERNKIEEAIETFKWGGGDMIRAEEYLISLDAYPTEGEKFRAVGRLITEFKKIYDEFGGEILSMDCMSRLMVVDRVLRGIDGFHERDFMDRKPLNVQSTDKEALLTMKRWNWWYDLEKWRMRREPWDEVEDLMDPEEMEGEDGDDLAPLDR
jgi:hypothetical protein